MTSTQAKEFADFLDALRARFSNPDLDLATERDIVETMHLATKEPEGVSYEEVNAGGVEALWCIPADSDPEARAAAQSSGWHGRCVDALRSKGRGTRRPRGRRAVPGAQLPPLTGIQIPRPDRRRAQAAYDWLLHNGYQAENIASVGHSVGGNFAVSLALRLRDEGAALPGAIVSISPWVDLTLTDETITNNADRDKILSRPLLEFFRSAWLDGTGVGWQDPRVNLLAADLSGLPPIAVYYGTDELLAGEAAELGRRAQAAGNDVFVRAVEGGQHSFIVAAGRVPEVDEAIAEIGSWLRTALGLAVLQDTAK